MIERTPEDDAILAILEEARGAPLPTVERVELHHEERRRSQIHRLAQLIQRVPTDTLRRSFVKRRLVAGAIAVAAAAAAMLVAAWDHHKKQLEAAPVAATEVSVPAVVVVKQVVGNVVASHADGDDVLLRPGMELAPGDALSTTAEAFASLEFEAGIRVDLASATTLGVLGPQQIDLRVGRVDVNVPKLPGGDKRLSVGTPNSLVVVRGTIFSVEVDSAGPAPRTRVGVTRGAVSVEHQGEERLVRAGELWSSQEPLATTDLLESEPRPPAPRPESVPVQPAPPRKKSMVRRAEPVAPEPKASEPEPPASSLSRQNGIFERGLRARDQGDDRRALYWFDHLLRRYPGSPLAESAERERAAARARLAGE